jgi:hypothetical protein
MNCLGLDVAPEAVICSRAKVALVTRSNVLRYIDQLPTHSLTGISARPDVASLLHPHNIKRLIPIRDYLLSDIAKERDPGCASVVLAALLGIIHGHASFSLSIPSAHAFGMAPSYVRAYAKKNNLVRPIRDIAACLRKKVERCIPTEAGPQVVSSVVLGSALDLCNHFRQQAGIVDVVLTSPPYFNAQTYFKDNWLRHWLLDAETSVKPSDYLQTSSVFRYSTSIAIILEQCSTMLRPGGKLICVAGDVKLSRTGPSSSGLVNTAAILKEVAISIGFKISEEGVHTVPTTRRYLNSLRLSNGHNGNDRKERYFVAVKPI